MSKKVLQGLVVSAIMGAMGFVLMLLEFPITAIIPSFIKFDFSELPALITSFCFGPLYGILVCFIKNLLHCTVSTTGFIGEIANFLLGSVFVGIAGLIYKYKKNRSFALLGCLVGAVAMGIVSVPINYFITYPFYYNFMSKETIVAAYRLIVPGVKNIFECLLVFNLPFNIIKGLADSVICFLVYKKLSPILKRKY